MKKSTVIVLSILLAVIMSAGIALFGATEGWAQQKKKVSFRSAAENSKYTKQYTIDVSANHQIRIFELHRTFPNNPPEFEGVKVKEEWLRGSSDYIDLNGSLRAYGEYIMENGDKINYEFDGISQTITNPDGTKTSTASAVKHLDGGTGKFSAIQGALRHKAIFDLNANINEAQDEGEYLMVK
ncbi:MAG: hypothetical protein Q7U10_04010 [Thermodesulfovibrionia bacterium]|nr:hypothetical protein [Thermodesulfovibrionia bacterium]